MSLDVIVLLCYSFNCMRVSIQLLAAIQINQLIDCLTKFYHKSTSASRKLARTVVKFEISQVLTYDSCSQISTLAKNKSINVLQFFFHEVLTTCKLDVSYASFIGLLDCLLNAEASSSATPAYITIVQNRFFTYFTSNSGNSEPIWTKFYIVMGARMGRSLGTLGTL